MVQAYNFLASWQLFPEKCIYQKGEVPKSGNYKIESVKNGTELKISMNWVSRLNEAFFADFNFVPDTLLHSCDQPDFAEKISGEFINASTLVISFFKDDKSFLTTKHEILSNGYLQITQEGMDEEGKVFSNKDIYHKQMSVLPYASSIGGVVVRPTKEGVIRHQALQAMEEQTNMQLDQIREQIELLARQAQEIVKRKELSLMIYEAKLNFRPVIGQVYHLYQRNDDTYLLSMVSPKEWGGAGPFKAFISSAKLLADHTWAEVSGVMDPVSDR
jgi:hypothetical protein